LQNNLLNKKIFKNKNNKSFLYINTNNDNLDKILLNELNDKLIFLIFKR